MNDKYEQLKQVIQAANPEIMELKFGCEVKTDKWSFGATEIISATIHGEFIAWECSCRGKAELKREEIKEILGRPIRLADVLPLIPLDSDLCLTTEGLFAEYDPESGDMRLTGIFWNLRDDNLDHQSEETKQFLINLLVP